MDRSTARRILIDGTMARGGGGFTYLLNAIPELSEVAPGDRFRLLLRSERLARALRTRGLPNVEVDLLPPAGLARRLRFTFLDLPRLAREWGVDLIFSASESAPPIAPCPTIASFRNPCPFNVLEPHLAWRERPRLAALWSLARLSARTCERILFVSADSARWMGQAMRLPEERRVVVYHGIDAPRWRAAGGRRRMHPRPYILSVSSIYRHKNFVRLIEAYAQIAQGSRDLPDLVIIGDVQHADYAAEVREARLASGVAERVHILAEVPHPEIAAWYAGAELFVFPSYLETFGFPLVEAMAAEVPVVAADLPIFREIADDAAFYADPHSAASFAGAMEAALFRTGARELLVKRGRERVRQFTWRRTARRLDALFGEVLAEQAPGRVSLAAAA